MEVESRLERLKLDMEGEPVLTKKGGGGRSTKSRTAESEQDVASPAEDSTDQSEDGEGKRWCAHTLNKEDQSASLWRN